MTYYELRVNGNVKNVYFDYEEVKKVYETEKARYEGLPGAPWYEVYKIEIGA